MATKQQVQAKAHELGADVDFGEDGSFSFTAWSPHGKVFADNFCHCISVQFDNGSQTWKRQAYTELLERMSYGLAECDDSDCDICEGNC